MFLRAGCVFVLLGILVAGLWPFHTPVNNVQWVAGEHALRLAKYGSILTAGEFANRPAGTDDSCSLEIWLAPKRVHASGSILAFYRPESRSSPFVLWQSLGDLTIETLWRGQPQPGGKSKVFIDDIFADSKLVFITISSNQACTSVYADGALVKAFPNFRFSRRDLTGRMILGNSPFSTHEWSGEVKGLAIYDRAVTAEEAAQHYKLWISGDPAQSAAEQGAIALYRFDEGAGTLIHNRVDSTTDLTIPRRFFILDEQFLQRPWREFRNDSAYWKDVAVNVAGFIPFGLVFFAWFSLAGKLKHPAALTVALGFAVSLTIEVGQAFLPTRNSGMTDLITNTLGTAIGVSLLRWNLLRGVLTRVGLDIARGRSSTPPTTEIYETVESGAPN